ncbi:DUF3098 domain-containing protein [Arcticibacterium luteifluviistationis]|uniref:DUF3098 domain-containing protein n=1 Tax=Arcticibacterium luteifluviistationis TaxID=1784714 RepID=A0A2Z4G830_9BACT|nr:DUF3098 domain-containing protein [Arcticibacterium luteifluviistationis]AWV97332.1 DUF3098 domain-containing protein [Arcticibacterium luteifluviistationis]
MSKKQKTAIKQTTTVPPAAVKPTQNAPASGLAFGKTNFQFMLIGIGVILTGFIIMTLDKEEFGFGFLGITLGPIVVFCGFMIELYAILKKKA